MKQFNAYYILLLLLLLPFAARAEVRDIADVPNVHVADRTKYVSNPDGVLSPACVDSLNAMLAQVWAASTAEPVVVALDDVPDSYEPIEFATELGQEWGVGKSDKDNGVVILLLAGRHRMAIATGRGAEGPLPDIVCGRIIRNDAIPYFREGNYDAGMMAATRAVCRVLTDPAYAQELRSAQANDAKDEDFDSEAFFRFMVYAGMVMGVVMLVLVIGAYAGTSGKNDLMRYRKLANLKPVALFLSFLGLGFPLPAYLICLWLMNRLRNHPRKCPNCSHPMVKLDEKTDNLYLTPAQDREEQLDSVDYDVWLCNNCGEKDVIPYVNSRVNYSVCPNCGARACQLVATRTLKAPTTSHAGLGEKVYACKNCGKTSRLPYEIAKLAAPIVIVGGGGGFGSGGGGISGGSFGGGSFGGGGASGGW